MQQKWSGLTCIAHSQPISIGPWRMKMNISHFKCDIMYFISFYFISSSAFLYSFDLFLFSYFLRFARCRIIRFRMHVRSCWYMLTHSHRFFFFRACELLKNRTIKQICVRFYFMSHTQAIKLYEAHAMLCVIVDVTGSYRHYSLYLYRML